MAKLIRLDCHDAQGCAERYSRALKLQNHVQIISQANLENQRWVAFVHNGFTSAVVLSHGMQHGMCSCEDFKKNRKTCKHIYASVLEINKLKVSMRQTYEEKHKTIPAGISLALQVSREEHKLNDMREKLDAQIVKTIQMEDNLEKKAEIPGLLWPEGAE